MGVGTSQDGRRYFTGWVSVLYRMGVGTSQDGCGYFTGLVSSEDNSEAQNVKTDKKSHVSVTMDQMGVLLLNS
jgi:hypothetical protein